MKKVLFIFLIFCFSLTIISCSDDKEEYEEKEYPENFVSTTDDTTSSAVTVSGKVQKGPYIQGNEITVRELDSSMTPTGKTFTGTIDDNIGSFSVKGTLAYKIVELSADGYYFNEVSGSLSAAKLTLQALSDLTDSSSVNVNLMTHLEKKRVEYLMYYLRLTFAAAKTQAQTEILKIFNIENVTLGNSETLDISKSGDGNAVLLAISAILQSDKTEAELTELLSMINTDIRTDGSLDSTTTKATLLTAVDYIKPLRSTIRSNIEYRYSNLGISATIPVFESYAFKLDTTAPTVSSISPADSDTSVLVTSSISVTFSEIMDNTSVTTNTSDTSCSGTFQVSSDSFSTCEKMSSSPSVSNSYKTFTVEPSSSLSRTTTYKIRVTSGVKDVAGNTLNSQYETGTGFTTESTDTTLLAHYAFEGNLNDSSSYNRHLTEVGSNITYSAADNQSNKSGQAALFNGTNTFAYTNNITVGDNFTIAFWINPDSPNMGQWDSVMSTGDNTNSQGRFQIDYSGADGLRFNVSDGVITADLSANEWNHFVITKSDNGTDNKKVCLYKNGGQSITCEGPFTTLWDKLKVGQNRNGGYYWKGYIDELRIYNRTFSGTEVSTLYQSYQ